MKKSYRCLLQYIYTIQTQTLMQYSHRQVRANYYHQIEAKTEAGTLIRK